MFYVLYISYENRFQIVKTINLKKYLFNKVETTVAFIPGSNYDLNLCNSVKKSSTGNKHKSVVVTKCSSTVTQHYSLLQFPALRFVRILLSYGVNVLPSAASTQRHKQHFIIR